MKNWKSIIFSVSIVVVYIVNSALLPTWSHTLVGVSICLILGAGYWLTGNKLKMWIRILISVAVAIAAAAIVRIFCIE